MPCGWHSSGWICSSALNPSYFIWSPVIFQDNLRKKDDRIEELEEALRESVQITAEREMVLAQEESARSHAEKQVCTLIVTGVDIYFFGISM